jgi:hypothetical protein
VGTESFSAAVEGAEQQLAGHLGPRLKELASAASGSFCRSIAVPNEAAVHRPSLYTTNTVAGATMLMDHETIERENRVTGPEPAAPSTVCS